MNSGRYVRVGFGLFLAGAVLASACGTREKPRVSSPSRPVSELELERDVAAVLSDEANVLCVHPADVGAALERLGATPADGGTYRATLSTPAGAQRHVEFALFRTERPYLCSNRYRKERTTPSPIVDLVAFMPASGDELCVHPKHQQAVLDRIGATAADAGRYVVVDRRGGEPVERLFSLKPTLAPILCAMGGDDEPKPAPIDASGGSGGAGNGGTGAVLGSGAVTGASGGSGGTPGAAASAGVGVAPVPGPTPRPCEEGEPPELCEGGLLPLGPTVRDTFYRGIYAIYDNANCNLRFAKGEGKCLPEGDRFRRETMEEYRGCGRGTGFCVSAFTIVGVRRYYANADCSGQPIAEEPQRAGACYEGKVDDGWLAKDPIFEDTFILFRNAACEAITNAFDRDCEDSSNPALGRYEQLHYDRWHVCKRGSGYCAETNLRIGTRTYYDLRDGNVCRAAVQKLPLEAPACKP